MKNLFVNVVGDCGLERINCVFITLPAEILSEDDQFITNCVQLP